jgi:tRNA U34 5-methylaminomethyl-2-thiouridine-forming methyltransferase MnmC
MDFSKFTWIRTRDGSPTLWHNEEGASFRSQKGAFTESFHVFVSPALQHLQRHPSSKTFELIEFGLGLGTNWCLWTLASRALGLDVNYTAIERDLQSFEIGYAHWLENSAFPANFVGSELNLEISSDDAHRWLEEARRKIKVVPSVDRLLSELETGHHKQADLWFHDPFGFDVNPSAYQEEQLRKLLPLFAPKARAFSYACNSPFQKALKAAGFEPGTYASGEHGLKRERLEFWPRS